MPSFKVMVSARKSLNLDFVISAEDDDEAQKKVEKLCEKLGLSIQVEKQEVVFESFENECFESMEIDNDEEEFDIQDVEEIDED